MSESDSLTSVYLPDRKPEVRSRRPYRRPVLQTLGEIRTLTLGASPGTGESAGGEVRYYNPGP